MLFLLPINEKLSWHRLPIVTIVLACLMAGSFVFFQLDDHSARTEASEYYFESGLSKIELPLYVRFVQRHMHIEAYDKLVDSLKNGLVTENDLYWAQRTDPIFQRELANGNIVRDTHPKYLEWRQKNRDYRFWLSRDNGYTQGFKTAEPSLSTAFMSAILHGNHQHLIGNLIFLIFIGINLELFIGSFFFLGSVILIQAITLSVYAIFYPYSLIPLLGTSGIIAGLYGMHALIFGTQRIKFFFNFLFYFNTLMLPGIIVIPMWLGWEIMDYLMNPNLVKSYVSHISGFIGGIMLGVILQRQKKVKTHMEGTPLKSFEDFKKRYERAMDYYAELNFPACRRILQELSEEFPNNHDVLYQLFNATKVEPASEAYHNVVQRIFQLKDNSKACVSMMNIVFKNYVKRAEPSIRFDPNVFLGLLQKFRKYGYLDDAEKILKVLIQFNRHGRLDEVLAREQLQLVRSFVNKNDTLKARKTLEWCKGLYPQTASAKEAQNLCI